MNISSIIIKAHSEKWQSTLETLSRLSTPSSTLEIALEDKTKGLIIATIEAPSTQEEIATLKAINAIEGILSADMHLSYSDEGLRECQMSAGEIAELIDTQPIESIKYSGDIKNLMK